MTWRVIQTKPAAEKRVEAGLTDEGLTAYLPLEVVWRYLRGRKVRYARPLFRGYVLAHLADDELHRVHAVDGVIRFVCRDGRPAVVPANLVDEIQEADRAGEFDHAQEARGYGCGDAVKIMRGPYVGRIGIISRAKGARRVQVLLDALRWPVTASVDDLEGVDPDESAQAA